MPAMDQDVLAEIKRLEAAGDTETPRYMELLSDHYEQHVLRMPLDAVAGAGASRSFAHINRSIYVPMQGPSELGQRRRLARTGTATTTSRASTCRPSSSAPRTTPWIRRTWSGWPGNSRTVVSCSAPTAATCAMYDDQATYVSGLVEFLVSLR